MIDQKLVQQDLSRRGRVRFAFDDYDKEIYEKLMEKFILQNKKAMDYLNAMQKTLGAIYNIGGPARDVRIASNVKSADARIEQARRLVMSSTSELRKK